MGSSSYKELGVPLLAHLIILCLRTVVLEAVDIYKNGKILLRQPGIIVTLMLDVPIRQIIHLRSALERKGDGIP